MTRHHDGNGIDDEPGPLARTYVVTRGRTRPSHDGLDMVTMVARCHGVDPAALPDPLYAQILALCEAPISVAEVSGHLGHPLFATKILLSDLLDHDAVYVRPPGFTDFRDDHELLKRVIDGLRAKL